jgi:serine/threonine protein kinase
MGLEEGTLEALIDSKGNNNVAESVLLQMLQALDCLAVNDIIHRDVKPANILYITRPDRTYQFQLGDFGLCNRTVSAKTRCGSELYMAPEMWGGRQTHKADVWSLFVTTSWALDAFEFRKMSDQFRSPSEAHEGVSLLASRAQLSTIREMATYNPSTRASAAQMLVKCFEGKGLSTPLDQVPALISVTAVEEAKVASKVSPPCLPTPSIALPKRKVPRTTRDAFRVKKKDRVLVAPSKKVFS